MSLIAEPQDQSPWYPNLRPFEHSSYILVPLPSLFSREDEIFNKADCMSQNDSPSNEPATYKLSLRDES